ncbi:hypothetical protein OsI_04647 [Oryza sativa Indica Group]|uniref:Uncharacterized protein n=2 Tax=Oryza TaxID=4527 RepID=A2WXJ8_ORYSI|nr:hypothetical protein OsI_04647 [Oryza sativa Indica Group]
MWAAITVEDNLQGAGANLNSEGRRRAGCNLQEAKKRPRQAAMSGRSRPWPGDPSPAPPQPPVVAAAADAGGEASTSLRDFGTSMDAISFGFAATAILVSMFLLMAIFEHLIKPHVFPPLAGAALRPARRRHGVSPAGKLRSPPMVETVLQAADLSVLMPGQRYPTYLAQPAPLPPAPCPREGVHWPPHDHDVHHSYMPP